jgi:hypothetical protein
MSTETEPGCPFPIQRHQSLSTGVPMRPLYCTHRLKPKIGSGATLLLLLYISFCALCHCNHGKEFHDVCAVGFAGWNFLLTVT